VAPPRPFVLDVEESILVDLRRRLDGIRWPDEPPGSGWQYGTDLAYLRELTGYWRHAYDWRRQEGVLNGFRHYTVPLQGIDLHFIHEPGLGSQPMPLLLLHGWPGSIVEFTRLIPLLTDPARFGGDPVDAFTVVAPSLPGFTLSFRPNQPRFGVVEMAELFVALMGNVLGYSRFGVEGGDWGAFVASRLGAVYAPWLVGIHVTLLAVPREGIPHDAIDEEDRQFLSDLQVWLQEETGYSAIMGTRPQTLAYALTDSPVGLAAWIVEKFRAWSDCGGDVERCFTKDVLLTNIMLYWVTGAINSAAWPYYARRHSPWFLSETQPVVAPTAYAAFPREIVRPPRKRAERFYRDLRRWTEMPAGGHFAALEQPEALAQDIRAFFRPFRG
jgi:microsomal epoxide hydrolase